MLPDKYISYLLSLGKNGELPKKVIHIKKIIYMMIAFK